MSALPTPCPLADSSVTTSSIQARIPVGIGNMARVRVPTIRPSRRASRIVLAGAAMIAASAAASSGGAVAESCGSSLANASTTSSVITVSTSTSTLTGAIYPPGPPSYHTRAASVVTERI